MKPLKTAQQDYYKVEPCLNPDCHRTARSRGLCDCCYQTAIYLIRKGKTTWEILEAKGRAKPSQRNQDGLGRRKDWLLS